MYIGLYTHVYIHRFFPQTGETLGVLGVLVEDSMWGAGPKSVRGNWPLWPPGGLSGLPCPPVASRGLPRSPAVCCSLGRNATTP